MKHPKKLGRPPILSKGTRMEVTVEAAQLKRLDAYKRKHRLTSRSAAIRRMIERA